MADRAVTDLMFRKGLRKIMGYSRLYPFMELHSLDVVQMRPGGDDFIGDTLDSNYTVVSNGGGASAASPVIPGTLVLNGVCDFVTGTAGDSTASSELSSGLSFRGDHGAVFVACLSLSAITGVKVELGFTDVQTDPGAVAVKATPTFTATDCALWCFDTDDNVYWEGVAANNGSTAPMTTVEAAISPVADTYEWFMVELIPNDTSANECAVSFSRFTLAGERTFPTSTVGGIGGAANNQGPNSNVLLTPWVYIEARNATSKTLHLDYWNAWQFRAAIV